MFDRFMRALGAAICLSLLLVACGGGTTPAADTGADDAAQEDEASAEGGAVFEESVTLAAGAATVAIMGKKDQSFELPLDMDESTFTDGRISLSFQDKDANSLGVLGPASTGSFETAPGEMNIQVVLLSGDYLNSTDGSCTVEMDQADADGVSGTFLCVGAPFGDSTADIQGVFAAGV